MMRVTGVFFLVIYLSASAKVTLFGKVAGTDGKPMGKANVYVTFPSDDQPLKSVSVRRDGGYSIVIDSEGLWMLHFTGTFHHDYQIPIYADTSKSVKLDVTLETYRYYDQFDRVCVIGNFNAWSMPRAVDLEKNRDGTYSAIVHCPTDTVFYRLQYVRTGGEIEGTDTEGYVPAGIDGYYSFVRTKRGKAKIVFDPRQIVFSAEFASFKFGSADTVEAELARRYAILEDARNRYYSWLYARIARFQFGWKYDFGPIIDSVKNSLTSETNGLDRQVLQLSYLGLNLLRTQDRFVDVVTCRQTLSIIPPNSVIWSLDPRLMSQALNFGAFSKSERTNYVQKVIDTNPMDRTKAMLLRDEIDRRFYSLDYDGIAPYLNILLDQYGNSPDTLALGTKYSNYLHIKEGVGIPGFSVESLSDSSRVFTDDMFRGRWVFMFFWATTSPTSLTEMADLRKEYKKHRIKGFTVFAISLDSSKADANRFWKRHFESSWFSAFAGDGLKSKICKDFDVYSVPKGILVKPNGVVASVGWSLRGQNLNGTLKKYVGTE